ncbi:MAG: hypothetical protein MHMPM18_005008, partial [Marteilia pararefringens]
VWYSSTGQEGDWELTKEGSYAFSCKDIQNAGMSHGDGKYSIIGNSGTKLTVFCDMTRDGGGWTLVGAGDMTEQDDTQVVTKASNHRYSQLLINNFHGTEVKIGDDTYNSVYVKDKSFILEHDYLNLYGVYGTNRVWYSSTGQEGDWELTKEGSYAFSCKDIQNAGMSHGDGKYSIIGNSGTKLTVFCDMTRDGGGWTLVGAGDMTEQDDTQVVTKASNHRYSQLLINNFHGTEVKIGDDTYNSVYVKDKSFILEHDYLNLYGVYGTNSNELSCSTNYDDFEKEKT